VTRQAIDAGLEQINAQGQRERMLAALEEARILQESMPMLDVDPVADLHPIGQERSNGLTSRN
jgi:hypothetical protein